MVKLDITGQKFGKLTAICQNGFDRSPSRMHIKWDCVCDCGKLTNVRLNNLRSGGTASCGCLKKDNNGIRTHGMSASVEYKTWFRIRKRCFDTTHPDYYLYGGRGITVCERWANSFENFFADMGARPKEMNSIDRVDVNGHYSPENCRWANDYIQSRNKRSNTYYEMNGLYMCMADWARHLGINTSTLIKRIQTWPLEKALSTFKEN